MRTTKLSSDGPPWSGVIEGLSLGSDVSFIINRFDKAGEQVKLHRHPYSETFLLRSGRVLFNDGISTFEAGAGEILVVPAGTPHGFTSLSDLVEMIDVHASDRFVTEWLWRKTSRRMERDTMIEDTVTQNSDVRSVQDLRRSEPQGSRVEINGMSMYYEVSGSGDPLIVLHGAYQNIPTMGEIVPRLAEGHRVYALEFQGHGRTTDIPRPITYQNLADDVAAFINALSLKKPNIFGYSMGAGAAVQLAIRHPEIVNRVAVASATFDAKGFQPAFTNMLPSMVPEMFVGSPMEAAYRELAPNGDFRALVEKLIALEHEPMSWAEDLKKISAPMLLIVGDADVVTLEHAIEMFRLLGGGVMGDMGTPLPASRLAVLPASSHTALINQPEVLHTFIYPFLRGKQPKGMFE